jgi:hypothetical protein
MLGIDKDENIIAAAAGGTAGRVGHTLEALAQNMVSMGARDVLLVDEGNDVFQRLDDNYLVHPRRGRIRAVFVFATAQSRRSMRRTPEAKKTKKPRKG